MRAGILATLVCLLTTPCGADDALFHDFANAVSQGDAAFVRLADGLILTPPTTTETIGAYGMAHTPAPERSLRGIIFNAVTAGHLVTIEDKYAMRLLDALAEAGAVGPSDTEALMLMERLEEGFAEAEVIEDYSVPRAYLRAMFADHVCAVEQSVRDAGKVLLTLDLPYGDTMFFWVATPDLARAWKGRVLYPGYRLTDPDWQTYWGFMTYALLLPKNQRASPLPDGFRCQVE